MDFIPGIFKTKTPLRNDHLETVEQELWTTIRNLKFKKPPLWNNQHERS